MTTQLPKYYPNFDEPFTKFNNWFTTYKEETCISSKRIFRATLLSVVDECRQITFNLPAKPQQPIQIVKDLDEAKVWETVLDKCNGYNEQSTLEDSGKGGFLLLKRHQAGHCYVCNPAHDKSHSFIFFKGKEVSILLVVIILE